ncbi:nuclear transport factor 2 family protein [Acidovorax sp. NCPPB 3576]|uniref:nuclear transport factor 2 family protein n=1 Tax=Acidovorax sp. NCPPB 3576 TaxID=2940488 RepID=UPI002349BBE6|nr:nuclear transport factor 2 family protein [Acidovorax sp. NCPPB 3576]WCM90461.1 nuclear transport factor 2 family protein [Acidovorax sp. NCPPB 3576]
MKATFLKTLIFAAIAVGMGATAHAADAPTRPQANQGKTMSKPTYVQDYQAISEVLNKYIEGCKQAKSSIMKSAFSPQATMYSVGPDGKLTGGAIPILFEGIDKDFRPSPDAAAAITRIEIVGTAASARIDANDMSGISFTDFFHLLKVDGQWTVVSKIFQAHAAP